VTVILFQINSISSIIVIVVINDVVVIIIIIISSQHFNLSFTVLHFTTIGAAPSRPLAFLSKGSRSS
jgi:hypothetical protein